MDDVQRKIRLRNREVLINKGKVNPNQPSTSFLNIERGKEIQKESVVNKEVENEIQKNKGMKQITPIDVERVSSSFNLQNELSKLKISVPFNELLRNNEYRNTITKMVKGQGELQSDILELNDDNPTISFGSKVENLENEEVPPFYLSLNVHDMVVHNAMLDSGASHNLMPKGVVESLGLEVTSPYKDLYSFDSRRVKCLGLNKDMVVTLNKLPSKTIVMDLVVADIPPKFGVLLSRSWNSKLKGSLQMDMLYATIPVQDGSKRLYSEKITPYVVSS